MEKQEEKEMNSIKFSHNYWKLPADKKEATLLHVFVEHSSELKEDFINYDTSIYLEGKYSLPKGPILILLFRTKRTFIFTTIRRWTIDKEKYYKSQIGNLFKIEIKEGEK